MKEVNDTGMLQKFKGVLKKICMDKKPTYEELERRLLLLEKAETQRQEAREALKAHVYILENLNRIDKIIRSGTDTEMVMGQVLDAILDIFGCDRAWLLYPCDPDADYWSVPIERTCDKFPGAFEKNVQMPMTEDAAQAMREVLNTREPLHGTLEPGEPEYDPENQFDIRAYLILAIHPKVGRPWEFGLHQCSHPRIWTDQEVSLFKEVASRIEDTLSVLLILRNLKESEAKYRSIMESMDEGAYICSPDFTIKYMNPAMINIIGRDATGERCYQAIHNLDRQCHWCDNEEILKGQALKSEYVESKRGRTYLVSHAPIFHDDKIVSKLAVYRDVTDIKLMEARLLQAQKMEAIGTLAGGIAHDFNNILSGIFGFSQLAKNHIHDPERAVSDIDNVLKGAKKATELVQQILTVSRKSPHHIQPLSIFLVIKESLKLLRASIPSTIRIKEDILSRATVMADPTKIHQVIMNLCTNAYHAMADSGGELTVTLKDVETGPEKRVAEADIPPGRYVRLEVRDTGHGIKPDILKKIFEPYFTTKDPGKGTGLGLAVVFGIVRESNGHIHVSSVPEEGTVFHVFLPIVEKTADSHIRREEDRMISGSEHILLVDDEPAPLESAKQLLEELGYRVTAFQSAAAGLEAFNRQPDNFDIIITDMTMPGMTGLDFARKILELKPEQPTILCTGHSELVNREKALAIGIREFLEKPLIIDDLAKTIRTILDDETFDK